MGRDPNPGFINNSLPLSRIIRLGKPNVSGFLAMRTFLLSHNGRKHYKSRTAINQPLKKGIREGEEDA
jgi:hypothetical protein